MILVKRLMWQTSILSCEQITDIDYTELLTTRDKRCHKLNIIFLISAAAKQLFCTQTPSVDMPSNQQDHYTVLLY
jgi:hypothetical protein